MHLLFIEGGTIAGQICGQPSLLTLLCVVLTPSCFKNKLKAFTVVKGAQ